MESFAQRIAAGFLYGDFQFAIDPGVPRLPAPRRVLHLRASGSGDADPARRSARWATDDWQRLLHLAHTRKTDAFAAYTRHYLATSAQLYHSDLHQLADYLDDYHPRARPGDGRRASGAAR